MTIERPDFSVRRDRPAPEHSAEVVILPVLRLPPTPEERHALREHVFKDDDTGPWSFTLAVNRPRPDHSEHSCELMGFDTTDGLEPADRLRRQADALESCARVMRAHAHRLAPTKDGPLLAMLRVYTGGRLTLWTQRMLNEAGSDGVDWLRHRLDAAAEMFQYELPDIDDGVEAPPPIEPGA